MFLTYAIKQQVMERVVAMEKGMEYMRGVFTQLFASISEDKKESERKMAAKEKKINEQDRKLEEQLEQIKDLSELIGVTQLKGLTFSTCSILFTGWLVFYSYSGISFEYLLNIF